MRLRPGFISSAAGKVYNPNWTPNDLANVLAWYDFSDVDTLFQDSSRTTPVTAEDQYILGVTNKAQDAYHLVGSGATQPQYKLNTQNGLSSAYLLATSLLKATSLVLGLNSFLVGMSYVPIGNDNGTGRPFGASDGGGSFETIFADYTSVQRTWTNGQWSYFGSLAETVRSTATKAIIDIPEDGISAYPRVNKGGTDHIGSVVVPAADAYKDFHLGQLVSYGFYGHYLEVVFCSSMTASEETALNAYLAAKWDV